MANLSFLADKNDDARALKELKQNIAISISQIDTLLQKVKTIKTNRTSANDPEIVDIGADIDRLITDSLASLQTVYNKHRA